MNDLRHDPHEGWYTVPEGEQPWGKTVRHVPQPDGTILTQTNVPRPEGTLTVVASGWKIADPSIGSAGLAHDCTTWTERTEHRIRLLEDAVNRIADKLTYLLLKLDSDGK